MESRPTSTEEACPLRVPDNDVDDDDGEIIIKMTINSLGTLGVDDAAAAADDDGKSFFVSGAMMATRLMSWPCSCRLAYGRAIN